MLLTKILNLLFRNLAKFKTLPKLYKLLIIKILLIVIISFPFGEGWGGALLAQGDPAKIDSLQAVLKKSKEDTNKVNTLTELVKELNADGRTDKTLPYIEQSLALSQKLKYNKGLANAYRQFGFYSIFGLDDGKQALEYFSKSLKIAEKLPNKEPLFQIYLVYGMVSVRSGDFDKALGYRLQALKTAETMKNTPFIIKANIELGLNYFRTNDSTQALHYFAKALKMAEPLADKNPLYEVYNTYGDYYRDKGNRSRSLEYRLQALKTSELMGDKPKTIRSNIQVAFNFVQDTAKALPYIIKSLKIAESLPNKLFLWRVNTIMGDFYQQRGDLIKNLAYWRKALTIAEAMGDESILILSNRNLGDYYIFAGDFAKALEYMLKAMKSAEKINDKGNIIDLHLQLGSCYSSAKNFTLAKSHFLKQLALTDSTNINAVANIYNNLADIYIRQKATHPDSIAQAVRYIDKALALGIKRKNQGLILICTITKAEVHILEKNYSQALQLLFEALALNEKLNIRADLDSYVHTNIGNIYYQQGDYAQALDQYQKSLKTSIGNKEDLLNTYDGLRKAYLKQKDLSNAIEYQEKYYSLKDSLFNVESQTRTEVMVAEYNLEKQNDKIALLEKDKTLQAARNERTTLFLILALVLVAGVVVFAVYLGRLNQQQKKTNRQLHEKNEEITQQSEELQQQAEELHQQAEELAAQRDSLERANENVLLLSEIGKKITSSLQFKTIFGQLYENINQLMDATIFGVGIYHEDTQLISYELAMEKGVAYLPYTRTMQDKTQLPVQCIEQKKEILINDLSQDRHLYNLTSGGELTDGSKSEEPQSLIYIPLLNNREEVLGVMSVQSYQKDAYNHYHLNILRNLAIYTSIAIENAGNLSHLDNEKRNLESINQELEALTEELRQQSDTVQAQRDQLSESSARLEELLEESQSQKEILELRNQEMEALQTTKDLMISAVNHDLRNPLNPILNYSSVVYPDPDKDKRLMMIHERAKMMFSLINDIMDVYRADKLTLQPQTANLHQAVEEAIKAISEAKIDLPEIVNEIPNNTQALFEYKYIERVFENFLSNAVKYTENQENGGKVRFHSQITQHENGDKFVKVAISDNGMGIPQDKFEEIFLPFSNPNAKDIGAAKSVGIGLTFCKTIVEAHSSQIQIESEVGKGTTFSFNLLLVDKQSQVIDNQLITEDTPVIQLSEAEKIAYADLIVEMQKYELYEVELQDAIDRIFTNNNPRLSAWKNALQIAKDEDDETKFRELLS
jgi:signal transduction histidine kinase